MLNIHYVWWMFSLKMYELNHWKIKKGKTVLNAFMEIVNESNHKPTKLWVIQGREFYKKLVQEWLDSSNILVYSKHNEGKSVIAERLIKTIKGKIYKKLTANYRKFFLSYLNKLVDQYNNTYHHSVGITYWCWLFCFD